MKISVTQTNIAQGDCAYCPLERAFAREGLDTQVGPGDVTFFYGAGASFITLPLPPIAREFVEAFDALPRDPDLRSSILNSSCSPEIKPFEFEMAIPAEVLEPARS